MHRFIIFLLIVVSSGFIGFGGNWPQWRGPDLNGISSDEGLPTHWSTSKNVRWKLALPDRSGATPIIWDDHIYLNVATGEDLVLWCVSRTSGKMIWQASLGGGNVRVRKQNMSSPSPVTDGSAVWALTGTGILKAFSTDGKELWSRDLQKEYGQFGLKWGYASSPLLYQDLIFVQVLHGWTTDDPSYVLAIEKDSGRTRWRVIRPTDAIEESPDSYTTPALLNHGSRQELVISGGDYVTGHDLETGKELWRVEGLNPEKKQANRMIASPVTIRDLIYVPSRRRPLLAFRAQPTADSVPRAIWSTDDGPDVPSPVSDGTFLYVVDDKGIMWCRDALTGEVVWGPERLQPGTYSASPVLADGKLYATSEDGVTSVVAAGKKFEILAQNDLEGYTLSSPAISKGEIFMRTDTHLYCIGEGPPNP